MKRALCVGINAYASSPLTGCVNDAHDWRDALVARGYVVTVLIDGQATRAAIDAGLVAMVAASRYGDAAVFQFSGHGTWLADANGDEPDRRDEALVPVDYARGGLLVDDRINTIYAGLRYGVRSLSLYDSCHSGSVGRFLPDTCAGRARFMPPAEALDREALTRAVQLPAAAKTYVPSSRSAAISGCADPEFSYDATFGGRANGAFTRAALDALASSPTDLRAWHAAVRLVLPSPEYGQSPQLTATSAQGRRPPLF